MKLSGVFQIDKSMFVKINMPVKINVNSVKCHSIVQKDVSCAGSHKSFFLHYGVCLETAGNAFPMYFIVCFFVLNFNTLSDAYTI